MKNYIQELLYEHNSVIIPALGGFVTSYKPASIDHVQGVIFPPSKDLKFNRYLTINDGVFIQHLCNRKGWTKEEAEQAIAIWVRDLKNSLERKEMIEFPNVGRLYLDFEGAFQFLPDNTNYNKTSYGLPTVGFYPVTRNRQAPSTEAPRPRQASTVLDLGKSIPQGKIVPMWIKNNIPYIAVASFLIFAGVFVFSSSGDGTPNQAALNPFTKPVSADRVNTKPVRTTEEVSIQSLYENTEEESIDASEMIDRTTFDNEIVEEPKEKVTKIITPAEEPQLEISEAAAENDIDTEGATTAMDEEEAIVIIGSFGNKDNADNLVKKIYKLGYEPFTTKVGKLNKIGVRFGYKSKSEIRKKRKQVAKDFRVKAWVMQPEM